MFKKLLFPGWILSALSLFLYSFTQVDLSLTLSRISIWQTIQKAFQYIGYFDRPLSLNLFLAIMLIFIFLYLVTLYLASKNKIKRKNAWQIIFVVSVILFFSYNAFSYDLFNYMFDAKIVTYYQQNPYEHKALDYPGDPYLSFMHWTHRVYPYGPVWLALTVPLSFIGFNFFLITLYLFKFLALLSFLGTSYFLEKILTKINPKTSLLGLVFFAFNPLVLVESLVSAHNDIVMIFFAVSAVYLSLGKKLIPAVISFILSIGVKFVSVFLTPLILVFLFMSYKKRMNIESDLLRFQILSLIALVLMTFAVVFASFRTNFQPWYLFYLLPIAAMLVNRYFVLVPAIIVSVFSLFQYAPYIYLGNWDDPVPQILSLITISSILVSSVLVVLVFVRSRKRIFNFKF
ncbi:hypothetical protein C4577_05950 [Candidatus Parcubacteria bacterium]|nr:MAG: hypothetical protein C4577_05950 [Candidatus Parcubacteria bacterium]